MLPDETKKETKSSGTSLSVFQISFKVILPLTLIVIIVVAINVVIIMVLNVNGETDDQYKVRSNFK